MPALVNYIKFIIRLRTLRRLVKVKRKLKINFKVHTMINDAVAASLINKNTIIPQESGEKGSFSTDIRCVEQRSFKCLTIANTTSYSSLCFTHYLTSSLTQVLLMYILKYIQDQIYHFYIPLACKFHTVFT